ncbi:MAG: STAS domain-containing protein [Bacteroidota bacterium]
MPFSIDTSQAIPVVYLEGRFLGSLEREAFHAMLGECREAGSHRIIVDFSRTDFIDSSGIGALIGGLNTMRTLGGDIRLAGMHQRIKNIFLMSRLLGSVFEQFENAEHAALSYDKDAKVAL